MNYGSKLLILLTFILCLSGCFTPGSHLPTSNKDIVSIGNANCFNIACRVKVYKINPFVINQLYQVAPKSQINPKLSEQIRRYQYRVGVGDILNITVWDHPELTIPAGQFRSAAETGNWVEANGTIYYPYIGQVKVANKTLPQIREDIAYLLKKYIEKPQVSVNVAAFRSQRAYITGEVISPGQKPITNIPLTVLDAINQSGGLTANVDWRHVTLSHKGKTRNISLYALMQHGDLRQNALLYDGDIIHLPRNDNQKVFIMGEVGQPRMLKIDRAGMRLSEALAQVGGIKENAADASGIFVIRPRMKGFDEKDGTIAHIFQLNMRYASALVLATEFQMRPYDTIYVTAAPIERWNRVINQLLPTISAFSAIQSRLYLPLTTTST